MLPVRNQGGGAREMAPSKPALHMLVVSMRTKPANGRYGGGNGALHPFHAVP